MQKVSRTYKDGVFRMLFNDKEHIIDLYNAVSGGNYSSDTEVEIVTLKDAIFNDIKNDLAFIIDNKFIVLAEHQSTVNPNMPYRMLKYLMRELEIYCAKQDIYKGPLVKFPQPELYVFYNGKEDQPIEQELKFSDAFIEKCDKLSVEAIVEVYNVNYDKGAELLGKSVILSNYSEFIYTVQKLYEEYGDKEEAVREAIELFLEKKSPIAKFLEENGGAIMDILRVQMTEEEKIEMWKSQAKYKEKVRTAKKLKEMNLTIEQIMEVTGLPKYEVEEL